MVKLWSDSDAEMDDDGVEMNSGDDEDRGWRQQGGGLWDTEWRYDRNQLRAAKEGG